MNTPHILNTLPAKDGAANGRRTGSAHIEQLLQQEPGLWRGSRQQAVDELTHNDVVPGQSTGYEELDAMLPWGAWPQSGLIEIVNRQAGVGELQLLMPLLRERSQQHTSVLWIAPPYPLHGPGLAQMGVNTRNSFVIPSQASCNQALWSIEKALQSSECGLVLAWQNWLSARVIRRLQLAAREGQTLGVLFHQRPATNSPSTLQLQLSSAPVSQPGYRNMDVQVLKARGSHRQGRVRIKLPC